VARINITEIRRRQIVDAAVRVMAQKGWQDTSIDEITREAGVSRGLVSYHFRDKADLLSGVLARCKEVFNDNLAEAARATDSPLAQFRLITRSSIEQIRDNPVNYQVFLHFAASAATDPELGVQVRELYRDFRAAAARGIRRGQERGYYRRDIDPDAAAARNIGAVTGFAFQWLLDPGSFPFDETAKQVEDMIVGYLTHGVEGAEEAAARAPLQARRDEAAAAS